MFLHHGVDWAKRLRKDDRYRNPPAMEATTRFSPPWARRACCRVLLHGARGVV